MELRTAIVKMLEARPALPVKDMARSLTFYSDKVGLSLVHHEGGFAILRRDEVEIHLWLANDESWRRRQGKSPVVSGAESFIAGTASCRIRVEGVEELYRVLQPLGVVHNNAPITDQPWGDRDFGVLDPDGNLVTFFQSLR
jgi:catechol 2,3-dioxygenase-like lactoylglutathione lyase family enzyme